MKTTYPKKPLKNIKVWKAFIIWTNEQVYKSKINQK